MRHAIEGPELDEPGVPADGQLVAFVSDADDLVPNDTNGQPDAFVYNRSTGAVTLVSVGLDGTVQRWPVWLWADPYAALCADVGPPTRQEWDKYAPDEPQPRVCA